MFTDLLDEYLEAKKKFDESNVSDTIERVNRLYNKMEYTKKRLNDFVESLEKDTCESHDIQHLLY